MKNIVLMFLVVLIAFNIYAQQQFTYTATKENISCNYDCTILEVAALTNNPAAIIFASNVTDKGAILNTHPIGAYYFKSKWHIFNLDSKAIPEGSKFNVEYFTSPDDAAHFQYSFARSDIQADGSALIDNWHLNNNPTVRFKTFPSWNPTIPGGMTNREEITIQYNTAAGKWMVSNNNGKTMVARVTYNIAITWPGRVNTLATTPRTATEIKELAIAPSAFQIINPVSAMFMAAWADGSKLPGENIIASHAEQTVLLGFEMGATKIGRTKSYELTIKYHNGIPATIQLLNAFINKQNMVFTFDAISQDASTGQEVINYSIKLTGASISNYKQVFSEDEIPTLNKVNSKARGYDEIKIMFTKIEYSNSKGEMAEDNL